MIYWAPLFHFYQPPTQIYPVLKKVVDESYRPLLEVFRAYPYAKATININAVLTEMLVQSGFGDVVDGLRALAERKQIEFTGSAKYHALLPLIPHEEMERQIRRNHLTNQSLLGDVYAPQGFFPPELCYSREILEPVIAARHKWILLSGVACPEPWPLDTIYWAAYDDESIAVFFRDDILSNKISFQSLDGTGFIEHLQQLRLGNSDSYVITAMDAETFGHHIPDWQKQFLAKVYEALEPGVARYPILERQKTLAEEHKKLVKFQAELKTKSIEIVTISQLLELFPLDIKCQPRSSSWSTSVEDIKKGSFYPLWKDPNNPIHPLQWEHLNICFTLVNKAQQLADEPVSRQFAAIARGLLDPALHSCQWWWANSPSRWDINLVNRGLKLQQEVVLNAFKAIHLSNCTEEEERQCYYLLLAAQDLARKIWERLLLD